MAARCGGTVCVERKVKGTPGAVVIRFEPFRCGRCVNCGFKA